MENDIIIERAGLNILIRELKRKWNDGDRRRINQYNHQQTNVYVSIRDESVIENLMGRHERPYTTWKKELLPIVAELIKQETGLKMDGKRSWNQRLGCSCPCSPGFKTMMTDEHGDAKAYNVWVTVEKK